MATHALFECNPNLPSQSIPDSPTDDPPNPRPARGRVSAMALRKQSCASSSPSVTANVINGPQARRFHRKMTREQGCAVEMLGHAVDYLNDSHFYEGPEEDILDWYGSCMEAVQLLICAQQQLLESIPLAEPFSSRLWNRLRRRKAKQDDAAVVPLTPIR